jgi:hypothetical protein
MREEIEQVWMRDIQSFLDEHGGSSLDAPWEIAALAWCAGEVDRLRAENEASRKGPSVEELAKVMQAELDGEAGVHIPVSNLSQILARAVLRALGRDAG